MFKPLTRPSKPAHRSKGGFADTMFVHADGDDDYSGFAPTEMFEEDVAALSAPADPHAARDAASTSHTALERAAGTPAPAPQQPAVDDASIPQSWVTSQWVAAQETKAHEAADQAHALIAAQRRAEQRAEAALDDAATPLAPRTGVARLRDAFERVVPRQFRSVLPLFIGVTVTVALISAVLPLFDKP